jgi:tryptophan synthase alpha chain
VNQVRIAELFKNTKKKVFVAYITAGDPTLKDTELFVTSLARGGVDIIELGIPYSDPIADGPTNIRASERALRNRVSLELVLKTVQKIRAGGLKTPIVVFTYFNPVFKMGVEKFAQSAKECGVDAVLFVDLPPEESANYVKAVTNAGLETVFLCSPTTSNARLKQIDSLSSAFVYYVSRAGVTGTQSSISSTLQAEVENVRKFIKKPVAIGFGISTAAQAKQIAKLSDGIIVGSALVNLIEKNEAKPEDAAKQLEAFAREISEGL